jgi:hypothetical protein
MQFRARRRERSTVARSENALKSSTLRASVVVCPDNAVQLGCLGIPETTSASTLVSGSSRGCFELRAASSV